MSSQQGVQKLNTLGFLRKRNSFLILAFSVLGFVVMGYHPGLEDDGVYLSAVQRDVNPALYPHDSAFFREQLQATLFDNSVAQFVRWTHIPVAATELLWQFALIALILLGCWSIARTLFAEARAQWAGVALVAAMFTLPVSGAALYLVDQHLHPRTVATAMILIAVARIMEGKRLQALPLLLIAFAMHPIMAALGISFCTILRLTMLEPVHVWARSWRDSLLAAAPLGWIFEPPSPAWRKAVATRRYLFLYKWTWYEWLGALAPLLLFGVLWRVARRRAETNLARFALAVFIYGVFQQAVAMLMLASPELIRLTPLQPMRYLHLVYFFMTLIGGCLLGKYLLKSSVWRWAVFLLAINTGMFVSQQLLFSASQHLELPGMKPANQWLQAFAWIRRNTPTNAYFALDPNYLAAPEEDYHSFRALAERSQLADAIKDTAMVTQIPDLAPAWEKQVEAQAGWSTFKLTDFQRLKADFGVNWVLVAYPQPAGLPCQWHNNLLAVCKVP